MRELNYTDPELNNLKHLVMCLPGSGSHYLQQSLSLEGVDAGHETLSWDAGPDIIQIKAPGERVHEIEISFYMFRYNIHKKLDRETWLLVRDPLKVAASIMYCCNVGLVQSIDRINKFYDGMEEHGFEGIIYIDRPCTWMGFDSEKEYGLPRNLVSHNGGIINLDLNSLLARRDEKLGVDKFLTRRAQLGY